MKTLSIAMMGVAAMLPAVSAQAEKKTRLAQVEFGSDFFRGSGDAPIDVSRFSKANPLPAGSYRVDLYVNDGWIGRQDVLFTAADDDGSAKPCFTRSLLEAMGIDLDKLSEQARAAVLAAGKQSCLRLEEVVQDAVAEFDSGDLRINTSIPQIALRRFARGYVSPELWDKGVNAAMLSYHYNAFSTAGDGRSSTSHFLNLNSGLNLGEWRFRNNSTITRQTHGRTRVQTIASYAQRSIVPLNGLLTAGDSATSGRLFDSFSYRGVQLASDPRMLPDSQNGYAPVVRGIARSNAKVQIRQNGNIIYETTVAPGRFEIDDLYPTGFGGNLRVIVTEADGSSSSFDVPYASVAQLLRPGSYRYSFTAGRTRSQGFGIAAANFMQGTYEHGVDNWLTLAGGLTVAQNYMAVVGGGAVSTPLGAVALNLSRSHARVSEGETRTGESLKLDYNKNLEQTGTNIALAALRYSSSGYLRLQELQAIRTLAERGGDPSQVERTRTQLQLSVSQSLGEQRGSFYASGSSQNYWGRRGMGTTFSLGYGNRWGIVSYSVSAQRQRDLSNGSTGTQYLLTMSMPLGREINSPSMSMNATRDQRNGSTLQSSLYGSAGESRNFTYGLSAGRSPGNSSVSANGQYRAPFADVGGSYSHAGGGSRQLSATLSGGIVAHSDGILLSQNLGDTIAIVQADGAGGATVNSAGVRLNGAGQAVVPYMTPFRNNEVVLDPKGTSTDVEMTTTSLRVAPMAGAVVLMKYETVHGRSVLIHAYRSNGEALPFGADVLDEQGNVLGVVGQGGMVFVRTQNDNGRLTVRWSSERNAQCQIQYALSPRDAKQQETSFDQLRATCETPADVARRKASPESPEQADGNGDKQKVAGTLRDPRLQ
ncbi:MULTISPECIES: fimbria/pilus outer membrane usher protein [unclassified Herbaspirillum]|uniref:fimbria/pilus outer membrane usher protein n=1 Tax=unclassified Herbaspirillum TaxID=2624150 RepID=UPI00178FFA77|nr:MULTISPECIES: fimbria/pilus outer membrane usher protein [unclassified Herbaspirillum]MBB5391069.1 outer membrane usher protein [Herbaspirillum sp. SJZ102]